MIDAIEFFKGSYEIALFLKKNSGTYSKQTNNTNSYFLIKRIMKLFHFSEPTMTI